jgi:hypothetical protein
LPFDGKEFPGAPNLPETAGGSATLWQRARVFADKLSPNWRNLPAELRFPGSPDSREEASLRLLAVGRALIAGEGSWVRHCYETMGGKRCAVGALRAAARFTGSGWLRESQMMLLAVARERGFADVETMNDKSSHGQVLSAFDEAIARARLRAA